MVITVSTKVYVNNNYAYVSETGSTQLQIIQASADGRTLSVVGQAALAGSDGKSIFVNSSATRAYIVTSVSPTQKEFFIIDISTKTGNRPTIGSYEAGGMNPRGVTAVPGNRAIIAGTGGQEYQVINTINESNPVSCGGLNIDSGVNGVASVIESDGDAFSYIITGDSSSEFKMIEGGPGGQHATSGTFISDYFDAGATVAFNRFIPIFTQPPQTTMTFQVAVAAAVNNTCSQASYSFIGPDGTVNTYFTNNAPIPLITNGSYTNPGRCLKYKAFFSTNDSIASPVLNDVSINYSP